MVWLMSSGWITYEIYQKDNKGDYSITPFSSALAASGKLPTSVLTKMRILQDIGWPEAKRVLKDDCGRPLIAKKDAVIWLLKCKPKCWRLYFYVYKNGEDRRIIYVHAVCKKANSEDANDALEARRLANEIRPGGSAHTLFEFPVG
jgi:hypothetical protein